MNNHEPATDYSDARKALVIALPIALYVSNGLVFELYDGGQPRSEYYIRWERLKPIERISPPPQDNVSGK